jgi:hypothetical protein
MMPRAKYAAVLIPSAPKGVAFDCPVPLIFAFMAH